MSKYFDITKLPNKPIEYKLQARSLPAYKLIFNDGYDEILIQFPNDPPIGFSDRFKELVARHGQVVDFKSMKVVDNDEIRAELNKRYGGAKEC